MIRKLVTIAGAAMFALSTQAASVAAVECIAPADPGGGWDFTCRTVGRLLSEQGIVEGNVQVTNMPGGSGRSPTPMSPRTGPRMRTCS